MMYICLKGILHLRKDECVFKMDHLCRRNVKLFLNLELSRLRNVFLAYVDERQQLPGIQTGLKSLRSPGNNYPTSPCKSYLNMA